MPPLAKHIQYFTADADGNLTKDSMKNPHAPLGITKNVGLKVQAIQNMLDDRDLEQTRTDLMSIYNPASSGLWDKNGNFNEDAFNDLTKRCINYQGKDIITKDIFNSYLDKIHEDGINPEQATTVRILGCIPIPLKWKRVTQGSVDELFEYFSDLTIDINGRDEKAFTKEGLKEFYEKPVECMERLKEQREPSSARCPYKASM